MHPVLQLCHPCARSAPLSPMHPVLQLCHPCARSAPLSPMCPVCTSVTHVPGLHLCHPCARSKTLSLVAVTPLKSRSTRPALTLNFQRSSVHHGFGGPP